MFKNKKKEISHTKKEGNVPSGNSASASKPAQNGLKTVPRRSTTNPHLAFAMKVLPATGVSKPSTNPPQSSSQASAPGSWLIGDANAELPSLASLLGNDTQHHVGQKEDGRNSVEDGAASATFKSCERQRTHSGIAKAPLQKDS
jgi:hypothetical protein